MKCKSCGLEPLDEEKVLRDYWKSKQSGKDFKWLKSIKLCYGHKLTSDEDCHRIQEYFVKAFGQPEPLGVEEIEEIINIEIPPYELQPHPDKTYTENQSIIQQDNIKRKELAKAIHDAQKAGG